MEVVNGVIGGGGWKLRGEIPRGGKERAGCLNWPESWKWAGNNWKLRGLIGPLLPLTLVN